VNPRILASLTVAAALVVPAAAIASTTAERAGTFDAEGVGQIVAQGRFSAVFGSIQGTGLIIVRNPTGDPVVKLGTKRQRPKLVRVGRRVVRVYTIRRAGGSFFVQGRGLRVDLRSPSATISVSLFGRGSVTRLSGAGTYHLNDGETTDWASAPLPLQITPPPPPPPRENALVGAAGTSV